MSRAGPSPSPAALLLVLAWQVTLSADGLLVASARSGRPVSPGSASVAVLEGGEATVEVRLR